MFYVNVAAGLQLISSIYLQLLYLWQNKSGALEKTLCSPDFAYVPVCYSFNVNDIYKNSKVETLLSLKIVVNVYFSDLL